MSILVSICHRHPVLWLVGGGIVFIGVTLFLPPPLVSYLEKISSGMTSDDIRAMVPHRFLLQKRQANIKIIWLTGFFHPLGVSAKFLFMMRIKENVLLMPVSSLIRLER